MCHPEPGSPFQSPEIEESAARLPAPEPVPATLYRAVAGPRAAAIVLIHDVYGHQPFYRSLGARLAAAGFTTLLPDLFHRQGPIPDRDREAAIARRASFSEPAALLDLSAAVEFLKVNEGAARVGTIGFCMGGTLAMLLAARQPLSAAVIYYGFPVNRNRTPNAPFQPLDEVEAIGAPLLGFWGDGDAGVGMENVARMEEELTKHAKPHQFVIYPGLPHGFLTFDDGAPFATESRDSWARTRHFLTEHLITSSRSN